MRIEVSDDGAGFDLEALRGRAAGHGQGAEAEIELSFLAGVSTREIPDDLAGHGVGLGAVRDDLEQVGYRVSLSSQPGQGARVRIEALQRPEPVPIEGVSTAPARLELRRGDA